MVDIEIFNLNEDLLVDCDYDGLDDLEMGPFEDIKQMFGLVTTPSAPLNFENIATLNIWTWKQRLCIGATQDSIDFELEVIGPSLYDFLKLLKW